MGMDALVEKIFFAMIVCLVLALCVACVAALLVFVAALAQGAMR